MPLSSQIKTTTPTPAPGSNDGKAGHLAIPDALVKFNRLSKKRQGYAADWMKDMMMCDALNMLEKAQEMLVAVTGSTTKGLIMRINTSDQKLIQHLPKALFQIDDFSEVEKP